MLFTASEDIVGKFGRRLRAVLGERAAHLHGICPPRGAGAAGHGVMGGVKATEGVQNLAVRILCPSPRAQASLLEP